MSDERKEMRNRVTPWTVRRHGTDPRGQLGGPGQTVVYAESETQARELGAAMLGVPVGQIEVISTPGFK